MLLCICPLAPCIIKQFMLQAHQATAEQLGYDRPSSKLLAFLWKHYGLANFIPQANKVGGAAACAGQECMRNKGSACMSVCRLAGLHVACTQCILACDLCSPAKQLLGRLQQRCPATVSHHVPAWTVSPASLLPPCLETWHCCFVVMPTCMPLLQFVVYEQYFNTMLGPGSRGSRPGATTSGGGGSWGATVAAANCYGNGRQTLHVLGSRAAAEAGPAAPAPAEQWVSCAYDR